MRQMIHQPFRVRIKQFLPALVWNGLRRLRARFVRCAIWYATIREIRGVQPKDRSVLQRSLWQGLKHVGDNPDEWQDPELVESAEVEARGIGRFQVRAFTDDLYHVLPSRERAVVTTIQDKLRGGSVFVDAGANIGFFTVLAARIVGPAGHVFAIEMLAETERQLRYNLELNCLTNVTVLRHALSEKDGNVLSASLPSGKFGRASIIRDHAAGRRMNVETRTLDTLLAGSGAIDLMKMDLESAEFLALKGAPVVLQRTRCVIFEQLGADRRAHDLLAGIGFTIKHLEDSNMLAERL